MNDTARSDDEGLAGEFLVREVFAHFGRAMYAASCVEHGLTIALMQAELMSQVAGRARREGKAPTRGEWEAMFDAYMARHDLKGMGTLISRFRSVVRVEPVLDELLDQALRRRNRLAHAYFRERAVDFAHDAGSIAMIAELKQDHDLFIRTDEAVQAAVAHVIPKLGIDAETHRAQVNAIADSLVESARKAAG